MGGGYHGGGDWGVSRLVRGGTYHLRRRTHHRPPVVLVNSKLAESRNDAPRSPTKLCAECCEFRSSVCKFGKSLLFIPSPRLARSRKIVPHLLKIFRVPALLTLLPLLQRFHKGVQSSPCRLVHVGSGEPRIGLKDLSDTTPACDCTQNQNRLLAAHTSRQPVLLIALARLENLETALDCQRNEQRPREVAVVLR